MYNFKTDKWTMLESAPKNFEYFYFYHGKSIYCLEMKEEVMWVFTYGQGWVSVENDGRMGYDLGKIIVL